MKIRPITRRHAQRSGFSLVELVITMTIIAILAGVVSMRAGGMAAKARASKIASLVENLKAATTVYHLDTNQLPREYSGYTGATNHRLTQDPGVAGWEGPYLETPINRSWNPTGNNVHLYASAPYAVGNDFDLDGDTNPDVANTDACTLVLWGIDEETALKVDDTLDSSLPGDWMNTGRVEYRSNSILTVLVYNR